MEDNIIDLQRKVKVLNDENNKMYKEIERINNIINELEKCIKNKYYEAIDYQTKIRQSDLMQGDYPVSYYLEEQNEVNDNYGRTCAYINGEYRCSYIYTDGIWLGKYKTKERALEVLDKIHQRLIDLGTLEIVPDSYTVLPKDTSNVYEMPKE